ncbi:hypothetical protein [Devosia ginsengisoli]|uniref:Copper oxidase n=1 Tax=Devosia ginsengisoli TaxID=400770 RepID=A0A5B8LNA3_9HYPH|nr:hypothetical protein [Devosia ginsengisoli]QDZ09767.1 hypothetical protein FPZ08_02810 [Devosia ginsengisoli]
MTAKSWAPALVVFALVAIAAPLAVKPGISQDAVEAQEIVGPEVARSTETPFRTDTIIISVGGLMENYGQLEYKISMQEGDIVSYAWTASEPLHYEFHGHSVIVPDQPVTDVHWYRIDDAATSYGTLVAPMTGIHGWYMLNPSFDRTIEIELKLAGHYTLEPGIIAGRTAFEPNQPATSE